MGSGFLFCFSFILSSNISSPLTMCQALFEALRVLIKSNQTVAKTAGGWLTALFSLLSLIIELMSLAQDCPLDDYISEPFFFPLLDLSSEMFM